MARIYAAGNGNEPIQRPHFAERPLNEMLDLLKISRSQEWSAASHVRIDPAEATISFKSRLNETRENLPLGGRLAFSANARERSKEPPDPSASGTIMGAIAHRLEDCQICK